MNAELILNRQVILYILPLFCAYVDWVYLYYKLEKPTVTKGTYKGKSVYMLSFKLDSFMPDFIDYINVFNIWYIIKIINTDTGKEHFQFYFILDFEYFGDYLEDIDLIENHKKPSEHYEKIITNMGIVHYKDFLHFTEGFKSTMLQEDMTEQSLQDQEYYLNFDFPPIEHEGVLDSKLRVIELLDISDQLELNKETSLFSEIPVLEIVNTKSLGNRTINLN